MRKMAIKQALANINEALDLLQSNPPELPMLLRVALQLIQAKDALQSVRLTEEVE